MASASTIECLLRTQNEALTDFIAGGGGNGGGGAAAPGGAVNSIQFNSAGALGGFGTWADGELGIPGSFYAEQGIYTDGGVSCNQAVRIAANGMISTPALRMVGTIFSGGDAESTKPQLLIEPGGTTSNNWSTLGTMLGVNAPAGFAGNLIDAQVNGVSKFKIDAVTGKVTVNPAGGASGLGEITFADGSTVLKAYGSGMGVQPLYINSIGGICLESPNPQILFSNAIDTVISKLGASNLRLGYFPGATPRPYTLTIGEASRPGTDSNVAGANGTIQSGLGTGTGTASRLIFQTPGNVASGSGAQTYVTSLTLDGVTAIFPGALRVANELSFTGATRMTGSTDGILALYNQALTGFNRLQLGGTTASFPAIKRSAATLAFRLADDTADCAITASSMEVLTVGNGFILKSPDGTRYRIAVANGGALSTAAA